MEQGKDWGGEREGGKRQNQCSWKQESSLETFIGFCLFSEGEKVGQHPKNYHQEQWVWEEIIHLALSR